jgi:D-alanyl-D-alanine carboxypeptidase/D-alanyl-D-alanine-endopeptidase (penicillin-binding protein 4)
MFAFFAAAMLDPLFNVPTLRGAHVALYAINAEGGAAIGSRNADDAMVPASTLKLVVGSATLDLLGPAFAFTTTLETDGPTLYVRGSGDPLLGASDFADASRTLGTLRETQFTALSGDAPSLSTTYPDGWQQDDLVYDYAAPPSLLSFDENAVHVHVAASNPGATPSYTVTPSQDTLTIRNDLVTGPARSDDTVSATLVWSQPNTIELRGSIPAGSSPDDIDLSVLDPAAFTRSQTARALRDGGITIGSIRAGEIPPNARVLWTHASPPLPALLQRMWQPSDNLLAESLLGALAPSRDAALERERTWLRSIGIDAAGVTLADGSGLSAYDRMTARDLVTILAHDWNGPNRGTVLAALPVAGKSGTLEHSFLRTPLAGTLIAKTGTVNHTRALAGYLQTPHGTIIFALLVDGWLDLQPNSSERLRAFQASVLEALAADSNG